MTSNEAPLSLPPLEALLGAAPEHVEVLLDYGYRAAWKVTAGGESFVVKCDRREGFQEGELRAHRHAAAAGVPVPEVVAFRREPVPCLALRWVQGMPLSRLGTPEAWRDAGRVLRLVHSAEPLRRLEAPWGAVVHERLREGLAYLVGHRQLAAVDAEAVLRYAAELRPVLDAAPLGWLHGDCQTDHFLLDAATQRVRAVLDWADAQPGDPALDFAVLTIFHRDPLPHVLDGYGASEEFREQIERTLPLYGAMRGAAAARWLDEHGFQGVAWPLEAVRELVRLAG